LQSLLKLAKDMEVKLHAILTELQELKNKARELEEENSRLRQELAGACHGKGITGTLAAEAGATCAGFLNLLELYDKGFHICNLYFGRRRAEECLFCMAFLKKGREPAAGHDFARDEP